MAGTRRGSPKVNCLKPHILISRTFVPTALAPANCSQAVTNWTSPSQFSTGSKFDESTQFLPRVLSVELRPVPHSGVSDRATPSLAGTNWIPGVDWLFSLVWFSEPKSAADRRMPLYAAGLPVAERPGHVAVLLRNTKAEASELLTPRNGRVLLACPVVRFEV